VERLVILDVDGTLVDTNYHHALAWYRAFREHGQILPLWRIHRATGMGGDKMVEYLGGKELERSQGDAIRDAESSAYSELIGEVEPLDGAREFLADLKGQGLRVVLASSAKEKELDHYLDLLDAREVVDAWTSSADVQETKPDPDLVQVAISKAGGGSGVMVGDTPWDVEAARRSGISTICLTTGGFARQELEEAGAVAVFDSIPDLRVAVSQGQLDAIQSDEPALTSFRGIHRSRIGNVPLDDKARL
jgi:HAD superfamily hydrolase (TIGR01549 family)